MRKDVLRDFDSSHCSVAEPLTFGSLFAGVGGLDLGFERAGLVCKWQVEIDPFARKILTKHWPEVPKHDDIRTFNPNSVDVVAGGFPCQDISYAGKGAGLQGERSGLFYEAMRVVREVGPRFVVLENVAALLTRGLDQVLGSLASLGYDAEWHCISAASVGAPHVRNRLFVIAYRSGIGMAGSVVKEVPRFSEFSWVKDVRRVEDLPDRCDLYPSRLCGSGNGVPARVDRLRTIGNAIVPQIAEHIGRCIVAASKDVE